MRKLVVPLAFFLAVTVAYACGDKLMLVMRLRAAQLKLGHPLTILAYAQRDLPSSDLVRQIQSQPAVRKAGHRFEFVEDGTNLDEALKATKYDLVLADVALADSLRQRLQSSPFRPMVVPVAYKSTKQEDSATQKKFHCLLKTPSSSDAYFDAIDQALQWKAKVATR
jgi:CheY-like chemotaxis protein